MHFPDKVVLEHTGALGDFLLAWPVFLSLTRYFADRPVHCAVPASHAPWLAPWATSCPPGLRRALGDRFREDGWPSALADTLVVRPGLGRRPDFPQCDSFWFLRGMIPGREASPTALYREALAARGIPFAADFAAVFRAHFGRYDSTGDTALLFPGAGNQDKAWPPYRLEHLAGMLRKRGVRPVFVLGPVERERGVRPAGGEILEPRDLGELSAALCTARCVVGPDCGPLHLAALHGVPGVALFGPTSPAQWGPPGMAVVTAGLACAPCTTTTADRFAPACPRPLPCMAGMAADAVCKALAAQGVFRA
jgi:ADP-heptose:LPS heptosyltransferase